MNEQDLDGRRVRVSLVAFHMPDVRSTWPILSLPEVAVAAGTAVVATGRAVGFDVRG